MMTLMRSRQSFAQRQLRWLATISLGIALGTGAGCDARTSNVSTETPGKALQAEGAEGADGADGATSTRNAPAEEPIQMGFIVAAMEVLPAPETVVAAANELGLTGLAHEPMDNESFMLSFSHPLGSFIVTLMPAPLPGGTGMPSGIFSPQKDEVAAISQHLIVVLTGSGGDVRARDLAAAKFMAAVATSVDALGASFGHGAALTRTDVLVAAVKDAGESGVVIPVGVDITLALESKTRASLLTHGMQRYGREELYILVPAEDKRILDAFTFAIDISTWMLNVDTVFKDGETLGRSEEERILIERVPNPTGSPDRVIRLAL